MSKVIKYNKVRLEKCIKQDNSLIEVIKVSHFYDRLFETLKDGTIYSKYKILNGECK